MWSVPIPSYLLAIAVGFVESREISRRCRVWSEPSVVEAAAFEFADTEKFLETAESLTCKYLWGRYDVSVSCFCYMEFVMSLFCYRFCVCLHHFHMVVWRIHVWHLWPQRCWQKIVHSLMLLLMRFLTHGLETWWRIELGSIFGEFWNCIFVWIDKLNVFKVEWRVYSLFGTENIWLDFFSLIAIIEHLLKSCSTFSTPLWRKNVSLYGDFGLEAFAGCYWI